MKEMLLGVGKGREVDGPFKGEVPVGAFIDGPNLAAGIGIFIGVAQHSNEPWLKFIDPVDGKTKYIAKKPFRHSMSYNQLEALSLVTGSKTIVINGSVYKVRLIRGSSVATIPADGGSFPLDPDWSWGSEWNRLMYPIFAPSSSMNKFSNEGIEFGSWHRYTMDDLDLRGNSSWCHGLFSNRRRLGRGANRIDASIQQLSTAVTTGMQWRPLLELVE